MIDFIKHLLQKLLPKNQNPKNDLYLVKVTLYYFFLWYLIAIVLIYTCFKLSKYGF